MPPLGSSQPPGGTHFPQTTRPGFFQIGTRFVCREKPNRFLRPGFRARTAVARARGAGRYFLRKYLHSSPRLRALRPERVGVGAPTPTPRPTYWTARRRDRSSLRTAGTPSSVTSTARESLPRVSRMALPAPPYLAQSRASAETVSSTSSIFSRVALICSRSSAARAAPSAPSPFAAPPRKPWHLPPGPSARRKRPRRRPGDASAAARDGRPVRGRRGRRVGRKFRERLLRSRHDLNLVQMEGGPRALAFVCIAARLLGTLVVGRKWRRTPR